jgi:hypothetical protein
MCTPRALFNGGLFDRVELKQAKPPAMKPAAWTQSQRAGLALYSPSTRRRCSRDVRSQLCPPAASRRPGLPKSRRTVSIVRDANGQALSYVYFESEPGDFYAIIKAALL